MGIAAYEYISDLGRFAISLRLYGRWRVRCPDSLIDRSFETPQQALEALVAGKWPVPASLAEWTELEDHTGETMFSDLDPLGGPGRAE
jgi:hypothetical protein